MPLGFCDKCYTIIYYVFHKSRYHPRKTEWNDQTSTESLAQRFYFLDDYLELYSLTEECKLCAFIARGLPNEEAVRELFARDAPPSPSLQIEFRGGNAFRPASKDTGLQLREMQVAMPHGLGTDSKFAVTFSLTAVLGTPAATSGDVFGTNPFVNRPTTDALSILTDWFNECVTSHKTCIREIDYGSQISTKPVLPTHILDLRPETDQTIVRLVEPKGIRDDYAALSHCWGPPTKRPIHTTKATLHQHLAGISLSRLPKSFHDAVTVAREANLRYLWIDSLCIVQDDANDWSREAPRMGDIYHNADLVIAASAARDSSEGCFLERLPPGPSLDVPYFRENGTQDGHFQLNMHTKQYHQGPGEQPLGRRGWVLQEWALARRIVHFTKNGMIWSCRALHDDNQSLWEDGQTQPVGSISAKDWNDIIEAYSMRQLTYLTDKLASVEGIARIMQRSRKDRYISGLWTGDFPQQLFWVGRLTTRPLELQMFPSWSWVSTHGPLVVMVYAKRIRVDRITARCKVEATDSSTLSVLGRSRECVVEEAGLSSAEAAKNPLFGFARFGFSTVSVVPPLLFAATAHQILDPDTREFVGYAFLDDGGVQRDGERGFTCLLLMEELGESPKEDKELIFLALLIEKASQTKETYRRVGVAFIVDQQFFQTVDDAEFVIV